MLPGRERLDTLGKLAAEIRDGAWELALAAIEEGCRDDQIPSLARVGRLGQLGDMPTFIVELAKQLGDPQPEVMRRGSPLAALVRDHAREREALGFAPREIVMEFLVLRRVLWRFVSHRAAQLQAQDVLVAEARLNDAIDRIVAECVVAYFDRATSELAYAARHDQLTDLLNQQAFQTEFELELERAKRYGHGLSLVFFDLDDFKEVNDTHGHAEGDRVLSVVATLLRAQLRTSDLAGRLGGDEFAVVLIEADDGAAGHFLARLLDGIDELVAKQELPRGFTVSPGVAHHPTDGVDADALLRAADVRMYEAKRSRRA